MNRLTDLLQASKALSDAYNDFVENLPSEQEIDWQDRYLLLKNLIISRAEQEQKCIQKAKDNMLPLASIEAEAMYIAYNSLIKYIDDIIEED